MHARGGSVAADAMRTVSSIMRLLVALLSGDILSLLRQMATMTLAALGWSICATGAGGSSHVEAPARLVAQHQNPAKMRTVLALLSHGYLPYSVVSVGI